MNTSIKLENENEPEIFENKYLLPENNTADEKFCSPLNNTNSWAENFWPELEHLFAGVDYGLLNPEELDTEENFSSDEAKLILVIDDSWSVTGILDSDYHEDVTYTENKKEPKVKSTHWKNCSIM